MPDYGLGRLPAPDIRDRGFPMRRLIAPRVVAKTKFYTSGPVLDQGATSTCVGHAWRQWLTSSPVRTKNGPDPFTIYREAQKVDEWPGEDYEGTSVRAGVKYLQTSGHISTYVWAFDADTVRNYILSSAGSSVVLGPNWYGSMFTPDQYGYLNISGAVAGGHAYTLIGYSNLRESFRVVNSWGRGWGEDGRAWIRFADVDRLIKEDGEAAAATEQPVPKGGV